MSTRCFRKIVHRRALQSAEDKAAFVRKRMQHFGIDGPRTEHRIGTGSENGRYLGLQQTFVRFHERRPLFGGLHLDLSIARGGFDLQRTRQHGHLGVVQASR